MDSKSIEDQLKIYDNMQDGEGVLDTLKGLFKASTGVRDDNFPPSSRKVIKEVGNLEIKEMYLCRKPLSKFLNTVINLSKTKGKYDTYVHLSMRMRLSNNRTIVYEKREVLNVEYRPIEGENTTCIKVPLPRRLTLNDMIKNTKKMFGEKRFFTYSSVNNNCQMFVYENLEANGFPISKETHDFIIQDIKGVFSKVFEKLSDFGTDIKSKLNLIKEGYGHEISDVHPLSNLEIDDYYAKNKWYLGTRSKDTIPNRMIGNRCMIVNLANHDEAGTHWVAVLKKGNCIVYFDSYGIPPPKNILKMMKESAKHTKASNKAHQAVKSIRCGYYCIFVIDQVFKHKIPLLECVDMMTSKPSRHNEEMVVKNMAIDGKFSNEEMANKYLSGFVE